MRNRSRWERNSIARIVCSLQARNGKRRGGAKSRDVKTPFKRLPYYCCALTFTPFEDPVCTKEGHVYDIVNIVPYVTKFMKNPVTGKPLAVKDLIKDPVSQECGWRV